MKKLFKEIALTFTIVVAFLLLFSLFGLICKMMTYKDDFVFFIGLSLVATIVITMVANFGKLFEFIRKLYKKIK